MKNLALAFALSLAAAPAYAGGGLANALGGLGAIARGSLSTQDLQALQFYQQQQFYNNQQSSPPWHTYTFPNGARLNCFTSLGATSCY